MHLPELPLFRRDLVGLLRQPRSFWLFLATCGLSFLQVLRNWPQGAAEAGQGHWALWSFLEAQSLLGVLVLALLTSGSILAEREGGTWESLTTSRLSPREIALSKLGAALVYAGLLLLATAPGGYLLYFLGGVDFETLGASYLTATVQLVVSAFVCLTVALRARNHGRAVAGSVAWSAFYLAVISATAHFELGLALAIAAAFVVLHAILILVGTATPEFASARTAVPVHHEWTPDPPPRPMLRLPPTLEEPARGGALLGGSRPRNPRPARPLLTTVAPTPWLLRLFPSSGPILERELRRHRGLRIVLSMIIFWIWMVHAASSARVSSLEKSLGVSHALDLALLVVGFLYLTPRAAGAMAHERERNTFDSLRMTLYTSRELLDDQVSAAIAKYFTVLVGAFCVQLLFLGGTLLAPHIRASSGELSLFVLPLLTVVLPACLFATALGFWIGCLSKRRRDAQLLAFLCLGIAHFLTRDLAPLHPMAALEAASYGALECALSAGSVLLALSLLFLGLAHRHLRGALEGAVDPGERDTPRRELADRASDSALAS